MSWHQTPKDDVWKRVTIASVDALGQRLWLHCACGHEQTVDAVPFAVAHGMDHGTPLLTIGQALRCSRCGERKGACWPTGRAG